MGNELAKINLSEIMTLADAFVKSGFFSDAKSQAQAIVKIIAGQELGFGPMASMTGIDIVKGKVAIGANLMAAALKRTGRYNYRVHTIDDDGCVVDFYELFGGKWEFVGKSSFSMTDAQRAGLKSKNNWQQYPRNMLFARAISNGVKWYAPDTFGGPLYTPDELGASVSIEGQPAAFVDARPQYHTDIGADAAVDADFRDEMQAETETNVSSLLSDFVVWFREMAKESKTAVIDTGWRGSIRGKLSDLARGQRDDILIFLSAVTGRKIKTSNDLGQGEWATLKKWLDIRQDAETKEWNIENENAQSTFSQHVAAARKAAGQLEFTDDGDAMEREAA